jgi:hypothetical protein
MSLIPILDILGKVIDKIIPDPNQRMQLQLELTKLADAENARESAERIAQTEVNKVEAGNSAIFVAGWRPAVGWSCVGGLLYTIIIAPAFGLPIAETQFLRDVLLGMLGINVAARSLEKIKGVAQNTLTGTMIDAPAGTPAKPKKKVLGIPWPF